MFSHGSFLDAPPIPQVNYPPLFHTPSDPLSHIPSKRVLSIPNQVSTYNPNEPHTACYAKHAHFTSRGIIVEIRCGAKEKAATPVRLAPPSPSLPEPCPAAAH